MNRARALGLAALVACGTRAAENIAPAILPPADAGTDAALPAPDAGDAHPLCVDGKSVDGTYPKTDYGITLRGTLPDLAFDAPSADGTPSKVSLHDYFEL